MITCILAAAALFYTDPYPLTLPSAEIVQTRDTREESYDEALNALSEQFQCSFINENQIPLVIAPKKGRTTSFKTWAAQHRSLLKVLTARHGALLMRGFPINTTDAFSAVVKAFTGSVPMDYQGGEGSRHKVANGVYTSTEAPPQFHIPLHHELSCTNAPPEYICFFCEEAPQPGTGQTLLASTENVTAALLQHDSVWQFFDGQTLKYISRHPPEGNFFTAVNPSHKTWQEAFETNDKERAEAICREKGFEFAWYGDWLEVTRHAPAIRGPDAYFDHPYWYNQAHLYHANARIRGGWLNHIAANLLYILPSTGQYDIQLEDGSSIPEEIIYTVYDVLEAETVYFDWQKGDVLFVDNRRAMHGKAPHSGNRRILVSLVQ